MVTSDMEFWSVTAAMAMVAFGLILSRPEGAHNALIIILVGAICLAVVIVHLLG